MKMKSKILRSLVTLVLLVLAFTTIGFAKEKEQVELNTISGPGGLDMMLQKCREFQDKTGVRVNVTVVPYGRDQNVKLIASFMAGGSQYDVFVIDCVEVPQYAEAGWALPIDEYLTPEMKKDLLPFAADGMMYKGRWYGLPWASEWKSFLYNAAKLEKAGYKNPPKTWADLITISKKLQGARLVKYGTAWSWAAKECLVCDFTAIAATFDAKLFDDAGSPLFDKNKAAKALKWMVDSIYEHKITNPASTMWTETDVNKAMEAGDVAFALRWGLPLVPLNDPSISKTVGQWRIALMPSEDGNHPYTVSGPMGWAISFGTKHPKEALEFIFFRAGQAGAKDAAINEGVVPGWASLYKDPEIVSKIPQLDTMLEQAKHVVNRPRVPWYLDFTNSFAVELSAALTRQKTPEKALADAAKKAIEIRGSYEARVEKVKK
ncbi:MAG: extracellular solute-binding protein [Firmicutes bacterium]|nr:extracellular solute-binding protein [Bacillota bacterium]